MSDHLADDGGAGRIVLAGAGVGLLLALGGLLPALLSGGIPARGDLADFFWPMKAYTAARWAAGEIPLWNPLSGGGEPWLAQLQSGALYPGDLPFLLGVREGALLGIALHLALAAAGAAYWLWELGASRPAALVAGGLYAGGGAFLSLVPVYNNAATAAWLPWLFALARRVAVGRSRGAGLAVAVAGAFLAGEPALAAAGSVAAVVLAVACGTEGEAPGAQARRRRLLARTLLPLLAGVALSGAALVPFLSYLKTSGRRENVTKQEAVARPVGPSDLADLAAPPRPEATRSKRKGRGAYLVTLALGPLPLLLLAGAGAGLPGRRRLLAALALLTAGAVVLSLGRTGAVAPALFEAGVLRGLRFPARWFVFAHLALAVAAGAGLDGWLHGRFRPAGTTDSGASDESERNELVARSRTALAWLGAGLLLLVLLSALAGLHPAARRVRDPLRVAVGAGAALLGAGIVLVSRRRAAGASPASASCLAALALVPLPYLAGEPLAPVPLRAALSRPPALEGLATGPEAGRVFAPVGQDRTLASRWRFAGGASWSEASVGRAAAALAGYTNLLHGVATTGSASPIGNPRAERLAGAALRGGSAARFLALLNAHHVVSPFPARIPGLRLAREEAGVRRYVVPGPFGRAFFPESSHPASDEEAFLALRRGAVDPGETALVARSPDATPLPPRRPGGSWAAVRFLADLPERAELSTSASSPSLLVLTRSWDPGWTAFVDGAKVPLLRAQLSYLAVVVPEGEHRLELAYRPLSFRIGLGLSAAGLLAVLALAFAGPPGRRSG